jgi:hypothetical protein
LLSSCRQHIKNLSSSFCAFHESFLTRIRPPGYPVNS